MASGYLQHRHRLAISLETEWERSQMKKARVFKYDSAIRNACCSHSFGVQVSNWKCQLFHLDRQGQGIGHFEDQLK